MYTICYFNDLPITCSPPFIGSMGAPIKIVIVKVKVKVIVSKNGIFGLIPTLLSGNSGQHQVNCGSVCDFLTDWLGK